MPKNPVQPSGPDNPDAIEGKIEKALSNTVLELLMADGHLTTVELGFIATQIGVEPTPERLQVIAQKTLQLWDARHKDQPHVSEGVKEAAAGAEEVSEVLKGTIKGISAAESVGRAESIPTGEKNKGLGV